MLWHTTIYDTKFRNYFGKSLMSNARTLSHPVKLNDAVLIVRIGNLIRQGAPLSDIDTYRNNIKQLRSYIDEVEKEGFRPVCITGFQRFAAYRTGVLWVDHNYSTDTLHSMSMEDIQGTFNKLADAQYYLATIL